jgi:lysophospholipid acyltransferase (LPLAT)-like uncharacterized protein
MIRTKVLPFIAWLLISLWTMTVRVRFIGREIPDRLKEGGQNVIYAFWHGRQFLLFHTHRRGGIIIPASESRDGDIQAGILRRFGFDVVRGSSKRKGDRALLGMVDGLRKGKNVAIAVDGPRGPMYEVKPGVLYLAGKLGKPIIPVATSSRHSWILGKTWEKFMLPRPFTKALIMYGEPIHVQGISEEELEAGRKSLQEALNRLTRDADGAVMKSFPGVGG